VIVTGRRQIRGQSEVGSLSLILISLGIQAAGGTAIAGTTLGIVGISQASDASADAATAKRDALVLSIN
tara:strand:- start:165830 stop:166036 length:207 start_codon:yes stop_codon:yes gene_type:complete